MLCELTQKLGLICCFCPSAHGFALRLLSDGLSRFLPLPDKSESSTCLRLIVLLKYQAINRVHIGDLHPISSRSPDKFGIFDMPGIYKSVHQTGKARAFFALTTFCVKHRICQLHFGFSDWWLPRSASKIQLQKFGLTIGPTLKLEPKIR